MEKKSLPKFPGRMLVLSAWLVLLPVLMHAQTITVNQSNVPLETILKDISDQTGYKFVYAGSVIDTRQAVSVNVQSSNINTVLDALFKGTNITYSIEDKQIALSLRPARQPAQDTPRTRLVTGKVFDQDGAPLVGASIFVEGTTIGTVADAEGNYSLNLSDDPNLQLSFGYLGFHGQTVTLGGRTRIDMTLESDNIRFDEVVVTGFQTLSKVDFTGSSSKINAEDIKIKGATDISRMLEGQVAGLSIQNVSGTFGTAPKIRVRGSTSITGENKPLWVIDGIIQEDIVNITNDQLTSGDPTTLLGSAVAGLNANDIESIDVLKDASATALYGARAMNGVVVVTTKRGKTGEPVVRYSGNFSIQLRPSYSNYDIMNSAEQMSIMAELERKGYLNSDLVNAQNSGVYGKMFNLINTYDESSGKFGLQNTVEARRSFLTRYAYANTDWFEVLFNNSLIQDHSVSISSGGEKTRTYASMGFMNDTGWTIADKVSRYTATLRTDYDLTNRLTVGLNVNGSLRQQRAPGSYNRRSNVVEGSYDRDFDINPFSYALNTSRMLTPYDEDGELEYFVRNWAPFNIINEVNTNYMKLNVIDVKAQFEASYKITDNIKWEFNGAARYSKSDREHNIEERSNGAEAYRADYTSTIRSANRFLYLDPDSPNAEKEVVLPYGGIYIRDENLLTSYDIRNNFSFVKMFGRHSLNVLVGQQVRFTNRQFYNHTGYGYQFDKGGSTQPYYKIHKMMLENNYFDYEMYKTRDRFVAFYATGNYVFDRRYVVAVTGRYDGSNAMGRSNSSRWLPTWTVSGKWNVAEEQFLRDNRSWIDELSLRMSYGLTASMPERTSATTVFRNTSPNRPNSEDAEPTINIESLGNDALTWEKSYTYNVGLDVSLWRRRLSFVVEYWNRKGFDLVASYRTPGIGGFISKTANYGDMKSYGWDFSFTGKPIALQDFQWTSTLTFGFARNKITRLNSLPTIWSLVRPEGGSVKGNPVNSLYSIQFVDLDDYGVPRFVNESGEVSRGVYLQSTDVGYLKYEGPTDPKTTGGFSNTFSYKNISLNVFLTFQAGNKIRLSPAFRTKYNDYDAMPTKFYKRWTLPGDDTKIPSIMDSYIAATEVGNSVYPYNNYNYSTEMVAKGDFLRLKTIALTYEVPSEWLRKTRTFKTVALTVAGSNLWMIYADKKLNGEDPEFFNAGGVAQPLQKQITFALSVGF